MANSLVLLQLLVAVLAAPERCSPDYLAVYRLVLHTHWTPARFPRQYPEWRPRDSGNPLYLFRWFKNCYRLKLIGVILFSLGSCMLVPVVIGLVHTFVLRSSFYSMEI